MYKLYYFTTFIKILSFASKSIKNNKKSNKHLTSIHIQLFGNISKLGNIFFL